MKSLIFACAISAFAGIAGNVYGAAGAADASYEQMVDGRIAVDYYNKYLQEIIADARYYLVEELSKTMEERLDTFVAEGKYDRGSPSFSSNWQNAKDVLTLPTRVPNWYSDADQKLFKNGIDQIRKDTDELLKICETLQKYFRYDGGWKEDKCKKYTDVKPRMVELLASLKTNEEALDKRALEMALAGEQLYWKQDKALGYFVSTMKADVDNAYALEELVKNPELQKAGNTVAGETLPKVEKLLAILKESLAKNSTLTTPALAEDLKKQKDKFYTYWLKEFIEHTEEYGLPALKKGVLKSGEVDRMSADNVARRYDDFISIYTADGGVAIKYKRH